MKLTLAQRCHQAGHKLALLTSPPAAPIQPATGHQKPQSTPPPQTHEPLHTDYHIQLLEDTITQLEQQIKTAEGKTPTHQTAEQKDTEIIRHWTGKPASYVTTVAPHLGSARTIERARLRHGYMPTLGDKPTTPKN